MRNTAVKKRPHPAPTRARAPQVRRTPAPAKISMPQLTEAYRRERLFRLLDAALRKRVVWIAAPAGAGKTSVVTTYLESRSLPKLWYNVDVRDFDVANLFHYLAMAARMASRRVGPTLPSFSVENQAGVAAFARGFFEALGAERPRPSVIVIDDYQEARSELMDEVLREALFALPHGISVIIISRTEAPPWLARHFAAGDVASVGWTDLRLTPPETAGLIGVYRPDLRGKRLKAVLPQVVELANGWAAALSLLLQTRIAPIDAHGTEQFSARLFDYFATEILDKAAPGERELLLKTSVVPRFTPELAARLTGQTDIRELLSHLERFSFLTQRLGNSGTYRYHPLLRDFLLRRADSMYGATALRELHRVAAEALIENDQIDEAMEQLEASQNIETAVELLLRMAGPYIAQGRGRTIESWIGRLPPRLVEQHGWLLHWQAASCLAYSPSRARELFERAFADFIRHDDVAGLYGCCAGALQAICFEAMDFSRCDAWLERFEALQKRGLQCPEPLLPLTAAAMVMTFVFRRPGAPEAGKWAELATTLASSSEDVAYRVMTGGLLVIRSVFQENMDRAAILLDTLRQTAQAAQSSDLSAVTLLLAQVTDAWARGDNAACIDLVREAMALAARTGVFIWNDIVCGTGAAAALTSENFEAAREFLALSRISAEQGSVYSVGVYYFYSSWEAFLLGDQARARRLFEIGRERGEALAFPLASTLEQVAYAQILWREGRKEQARAALDLARQRAEEARYPLIRFGCDLVESDHEWDEDRERALARLRRGFEMARAGGYHNTFWLSKSILTRLATRALEHGIEPEHVRATIAKHRLMPATIPPSPEGWPFRYHLRALGQFELESDVAHDSAEVVSPRQKRGGSAPSNRSALRGMPLRLLQAVLAFGARGVRDTQLIDALWPDAEGDAGRRVFDTTLHRLRRQIGADDVIRLTDGRVYLDERLCWVDVWALEHALREVERQVAHRAPVPVIAQLAHQILALYRGPLLADNPPGDWAGGPRKQLAAKVRRATEALAGALDAAGRPGEAKALYQRAFQTNQLAIG
jgi:ATP/maltotriose-dependent transcriptional regulator MalT